MAGRGAAHVDTNKNLARAHGSADDAGSWRNWGKRSRQCANFDNVLLHPRSDVAIRKTGDEVFLVHLSHGTVFQLNRTGQMVWESLETKSSPKEITERLSSCYGLQPEAVAADVRLLLQELLEHSLLEILAEAGPCASSSNCR